jgi:hypothetical protein
MKRVATPPVVIPVRLRRIYQIHAVPTQYAIEHAGFGPWSLVYEDMNNDGLYNPQVDKTLSFSGTIYTGSTPNFVYSAPVLNSPVHDKYSSPFTNGAGAPLSTGTNHSNCWQFTMTPYVIGQEGAVADQYFTYIQTAVCIIPVGK